MSQELENRIVLLAQGIAADIRTLLAQDGSLDLLNTVDKTSLVAAINEVSAASPVGVLFANSNLSDVQDAMVSRTNLGVRSNAEITSEITNAVAGVTLAVLGGLTEAEVDARAQAALAANIGTAPEVLNTIQEIAAELASDDTAFAALATTVATKISFSAVQTLTLTQKQQAASNIGIGNIDRNFLADYQTARDAA